MKITNMSPHPIRIVKKDGSEIILTPSGIVPRIEQKRVIVDTVDGIEIFEDQIQGVIDMPEPEEGVMIVTSRFVASALTGRSDVFVPGDFIRDENGNIIACKGLTRLV